MPHPVSIPNVIDLGPGLSAKFRDAGHILGSALIELTFAADGGARTVVFSGDIGRRDKPFVHDPSVFRRADYLVMESTYADRNHEDPQKVEDILLEVVREAVRKGGNVVIPTFAMERAQELMYHFSHLARGGALPPVPVYLDSPMAREVTQAFERHPEVLDEEARELFRSGQSPFAFPGLTIVRSIEESQAIQGRAGTSVIMAGGGMCKATTNEGLGFIGRDEGIAAMAVAGVDLPH